MRLRIKQSVFKMEHEALAAWLPLTGMGGSGSGPGHHLGCVGAGISSLLCKWPQCGLCLLVKSRCHELPFIHPLSCYMPFGTWERRPNMSVLPAAAAAEQGQPLFAGQLGFTRPLLRQAACAFESLHWRGALCPLIRSTLLRGLSSSRWPLSQGWKQGQASTSLLFYWPSIFPWTLGGDRWDTWGCWDGEQREIHVGRTLQRSEYVRLEEAWALTPITVELFWSVDGGGGETPAEIRRLDLYKRPQIRGDWAGTVATCDPWAYLPPFWVPHLPLLCRHVTAPPPPVGAGLACWGGTRGCSEDRKCLRKGASPAGCGAGGGGLSVLSRKQASQQLRGALGPPCLFLAGRGDGNIYLSCGVWHCCHQAPSGKPFSGSREPSLKSSGEQVLGRVLGLFFLGKTWVARHLSRARGSPGSCVAKADPPRCARGFSLCWASPLNSEPDLV